MCNFVKNKSNRGASVRSYVLTHYLSLNANYPYRATHRKCIFHSQRVVFRAHIVTHTRSHSHTQNTHSKSIDQQTTTITHNINRIATSPSSWSDTKKNTHTETARLGSERRWAFTRIKQQQQQPQQHNPIQPPLPIMTRRKRCDCDMYIRLMSRWLSVCLMSTHYVVLWLAARLCVMNVHMIWFLLLHSQESQLILLLYNIYKQLNL